MRLPGEQPQPIPAGSTRRGLKRSVLASPTARMTTNTESLYTEHLASHAGANSEAARAAEEAAFAALLRAHPEQAEALKELRAAQQRLGGAVPRTLSEKTSGLHRPAGAKELPTSAFHAREGATIGDFKLTRLLGRGGMGEVWEAGQASLSRKVALKLMLPDRVSERGLDFFAREARAGGRLAHKGIVTVFGTGVNDGAHWIAMELVDGACDLRRSLDAMRDEAEVPESYYEDTAAFIAELADALEVAHQAGVIHRDLKPANILVAVDDSPKVSDFGLAKLEDELSISNAGELLGTYYYMSPEQVATKRAGIDHRTDIFSLGVVMYEMLTLVRPFEGDTTEQVAQKILWEEAPDPKAVRSRVPRDLSVICGKAMEKDPGRRYQTMSEVAADLRRHLADRPIQAKPPTATEVAIKWTKRNPTKTAASAVAAAAFAAISTLAVQLQQRGEELTAQTEKATESAALALERADELAQTNEALEEERQAALAAREEATRERDSAEERAAELVQVADFQGRQISGIDPKEMGEKIRSLVMEGVRTAGDRAGRGADELESEQAALAELLSGADFTGVAAKVLDEEVLERALLELEGFDNQPAIQAHLLQTVATALKDFGFLDRALEAQVKTVELYRLARGDEHSHTLTSLNNLGDVLLRKGKYAEAEPLFVEVLEARRRINGELNPRTLTAINNLAGLVLSQGKLERAEKLFEEALEGHRQALGEEHPDTLTSRFNLGSVYSQRGKTDEATEIFREVLEIQRRVLGDEHRETLATITGLASALTHAAKYEEAEALHLESLEGRRRVLGDRHPKTLHSIGNVGLFYLNRGEGSRGEEFLIEALEGRRIVLGEDHPDTLTGLHNLGLLLRTQGQLAKAEELFRESMAAHKRVLGDEHVDTAVSVAVVGTILCDQRRFDEAEPFVREAREKLQLLLGEEHPRVLGETDTLATLLAGKGEYAEAEAELRAAVVIARRKLGLGHPATLKLLNRTGLVLVQQEKREAALPFYRECLDGYRRAAGDKHPNTLTITHNLGMLLKGQQKYEEAEPLLRAALAGRREVLGGDHPETRYSIYTLALTAARLREWEEAEQLYREVLEKDRRLYGDRHGQTRLTIGNLAVLLKEHRRFEEAEPLAREFLEGTPSDHPDYPNRVGLLEDIVAGLKEESGGPKGESDG